MRPPHLCQPAFVSCLRRALGLFLSSLLYLPTSSAFPAYPLELRVLPAFHDITGKAFKVIVWGCPKSSRVWTFRDVHHVTFEYLLSLEFVEAAQA